MLTAQLFCCPRGIAADRLAHILIGRNPIPERAAADNFLLSGGKLLQRQATLAAQLPYRSFEHHREVLADKADIALRQLEYRADPHRFKLFPDPPPDAPDLAHRQQRHQLSLPLRAGQVHYPARLSRPLLRRVVGQLRQGFGLGDANAQRQMGTLQHRGADFAAKIGQISAMTHTADIAKGLIDTVNFAARGELFQGGHHPAGHVGIQLIITAKRHDAVAKKRSLLLKVGFTHFHKRLRLRRAGDHAAVVVRQHHHRPPLQVWPEGGLTAGIEGVHITMREHDQPAALMM